MSPSGRVERWTESETGGLEPASSRARELVRWKSFDGRVISGFLYAPPARFTGKRPVIINIHGGPEGQARPDFLGKRQLLPQRAGRRMIFPNVRGSTGYGKTFLELDNGILREDSVKDIGALLDWIATRPDLDAARVMVTGGSYGGYMTLAVATTYNDRIRCSVDVVGISNFVTFLERHRSLPPRPAPGGVRRRARPEDARVPRRRSRRSTTPRRSPSRCSWSRARTTRACPTRESEQMVATVKKNGTPVWYLMANDEGHGFAKKKNADFQFYATIAFMQEFLLK